MSFDLHTFLYNLLGAIVGLVISLGLLFGSFAVAVYFDSWLCGVLTFLAPMFAVVIYKMGQKHEV
jgi:hypothetical protein